MGEREHGLLNTVILEKNAEVKECNFSMLVFYVKILFKECVLVPSYNYNVL